MTNFRLNLVNDRQFFGPNVALDLLCDLFGTEPECFMIRQNQESLLKETLDWIGCNED